MRRLFATRSQRAAAAHPLGGCYVAPVTAAERFGRGYVFTVHAEACKCNGCK